MHETQSFQRGVYRLLQLKVKFLLIMSKYKELANHLALLYSVTNMLKDVRPMTDLNLILRQNLDKVSKTT